MEISFCFDHNSNTVVNIHFSIWYNSNAAIVYAKFCDDLVDTNRIIINPMSHRIWIGSQKHLVKQTHRWLYWLFPSLINPLLPREYNNTSVIYINDSSMVWWHSFKMAWYHTGAKSLIKPMMTNFNVDSKEHYLNPLWPSDAIWRHGFWVNIGSGNGLLPDGTKPLPEPMLTDHQWSPVTFILRQFHKRYLIRQCLKSIWISYI